MNFLIVQFILFFIIAICLVESLRYLTRRKSLNREVIRNKIQMHSYVDSGSDPSDMLRKKVLSNVRLLNDILWRIPGILHLDRLIQQANLNYPLGFFILLTLLLLITGYYGASLMMRSNSIPLLLAIVLSSLPYLYVRMKKNERMKKFEQQLPEGMEFLSRALRAGHAFTGSMKLAAENFDDPLGTEFEKTLDEINFGISTNDALKNLLHRVDSADLRYFTASVILQRETGGNLSEIMDSIARIIRERFKFRDKVRVLSAEGRFSAAILIAIPILVILYLQFMQRGYLSTLTTEPVGKIIITISISMALLGIVLIRKLITINI
jgi:tight adherence protein B